MINNSDFNEFLKYGSIGNIGLGCPMNLILEKYGHNNWTIKEKESNGLIYGIIFVGIFEFQIYNEVLTGMSVQIYAYDKDEYKNIEAPWVVSNIRIKNIIDNLNKEKIKFEEYSVAGPKNKYNTAGTELINLSDDIHTFIDTEGGVTFLIDSDDSKVYRICKNQ